MKTGTRSFIGSLALALILVLLPDVAHGLAETSVPPPPPGQDAVAYQMTPGHTGASTDPVGPQWSRSWTKTLGGTVSYPLVADGEVFVLVDSPSPSLFAFDAATGAVNWQVAVGVNPFGIAFDNGRIFEMSDGLLSAYDALTGSLDWTTPNTDDAAPTAVGGVVYTGLPSAVNESDGTVQWSAPLDPDYAGDGTPAVGDGDVFMASYCLTNALNESTDASVWGNSLGCSGPEQYTPVLSAGNLYLRNEVVAAATGAEIGSLSAGPAPAVDGSDVYAEDNGTLTAQTVALGAPLWSFTGDGHLDTAPIVDNGVVYEGSSSGVLYGLSAITGQVLWSTTLPSALGPPVNAADSFWGMAEGDGLLVVPAGDTLTVFDDPATAPSAPAGVSAAQSGSQALLRWTVPADNGSPINSFTITPSIDGATQTPVVVGAGTVGSATDPTPGASDNYIVTGLTGGPPETFTVAANNDGGEGGATPALYAPTITSAAGATFALGEAGSFVVTAGGNSLPGLAESGNLPSGVTFTDNGNGTAILTGTPGPGTLGTYPITITASNGMAPAATQSFVLSVEPPLVITSASAATFTVGASGSFTVTTDGSPAPSYSETGPLPAGVTLSSAGVLSGTPAPDTGGSYPITVTAANGTVPNASQSFVLTVDSAPAFATQAAASFAAGEPDLFVVTATGYPTPAFTASASLPSGVTFTDEGNGTALLAGTPQPSTLGIYPLTIVADNGVGKPAAQTIDLTVGTAPVITSVATTTFAVGSAGSFTATADGTPAPIFSATGTLPAGVSWSGTGTLSGTPGPGTAGTYPITITASNGMAPDAAQSFVLTVDTAPTITSPAGTSFASGDPDLFVVTATGIPVPALAVDGALPNGVTFTDNGNGTALLAGTPGPGTLGSYPITITATNGVGTPVTQSFTLTVGTAPMITSPSAATLAVGSAGSFTVTADGTPAPTFSEAGLLPAGVSWSGNGTLSGTPARGTAGSYPVTVTATNGVAPDATQSFVLTIDGAPVITSGSSVVFPQGRRGSFTISTNGLPTAALSESGVLPSGLGFTDNGNGSATLAGIPSNGTFGAYPITITATNPLGSAVQSFDLMVGTPTVITSAPATNFTVGAADSFTFETSGFPAPTFSETGSLPAGISLSPGGVLSGVVNPNDLGTYAVTVTASNGVGLAATQNFVLTIDSVPQFSTVPTITFVTGQAHSFSLAASGDPTPTISESGPLPNGVTFTPGANGTATVSGTASVNAVGNYPVFFTAANGVGNPVVQSTSVTVDAPLSFTGADSATFTPGSFGSFTFAVTPTESPAPTFSYSGAPLPLGLSLSSNGVLSGSADVPSGGVFSIDVWVTNGWGTPVSEEFLVDVEGAPTIYTTNETVFTPGQSGAFNVGVRGYPDSTVTETGPLPAGLTFTTNGVLYGTPAPGSEGAYPITITASNGSAPDATQAFTIYVGFSIATTSLPAGVKGHRYAQQMSAIAGSSPYQWKLATGDLPPGLRLGKSSGTITGQPRVTGTYHFTVEVTDRKTKANHLSNHSATASLSITIS